MILDAHLACLFNTRVLHRMQGYNPCILPQSSGADDDLGLPQHFSTAAIIIAKDYDSYKLIPRPN